MDTLSRNSNMRRNTILCLLMATLDLVVVRFSGSILMYGDILPDSLFLWFMNPPFWPYIYFEHSNRFSPLFKINIKWFFLKCIIFAIASSKNKKKNTPNCYCVAFVLIFVGNCRPEFAHICNRETFMCREDNSTHCEVIISEFIWWGLFLPKVLLILSF